MIDINLEHILTFSQAADWLPRRRAGKKTSASTLWRWREAGVRGIRLEVIQIGGTCCMSREALQRFFERVTAARSGGPAPTDPRPDQTTRTESQRRKASAQAGADLDRMIANPPRRPACPRRATAAK